jgi:two-component system response regulator RegA
MSGHLLIVEDDANLRGQLGRAFRGRGYRVTEVASLTELARACAAAAWSAAVVDVRLPDGSGLDALRLLREADGDLPVVMVTGYGSIANAIEAVRQGALDYLTKPVDVDQILAALARGVFAGGTGEAARPAEAGTHRRAPSLERVEWEHIQRVLADCGGNVSRAARVLGIHRRTLQRKLSYRPRAR